MKKPFVSVVMPVYKKELYVEECVRSILNQTFKDMELICIDDHSPDQSGAILQKLAKEDNRIKIITNDRNMGASISRNIGMQMAQGKYLLVFDADDFYDEELMEKAINQCEENQLDVLLYDYCMYYEKTGNKVGKCVPLVYRELLEDKKVFSGHDIEMFSFQMCSASGCTKMYNREFIESNQIRFQDISSANEALFNRLAVICAKRIGYAQYCWMNYRIGCEGQISERAGEHSLNYAKMGTALKHELMVRGLYGGNKKSFLTYIFTAIMSYIGSIECKHWELYYHQIKAILSDIVGQATGAFLSSYYEYWYQDFMNLSGYNDVQGNVLNEYYYIFQYQKDKVRELIKYLEKCGCKVILWGYGKNGRAFYEKCGEYGITVDIIVDINCDGRKVFPPDVLHMGKYVVLVASANLTEGMLKKAMQINDDIMVVDIQSFFSYGIELNKCIFKKENLEEGFWG